MAFLKTSAALSNFPVLKQLFLRTNHLNHWICQSKDLLPVAFCYHLFCIWMTSCIYALIGLHSLLWPSSYGLFTFIYSSFCIKFLQIYFLKKTVICKFSTCGCVCAEYRDIYKYIRKNFFSNSICSKHVVIEQQINYFVILIFHLMSQ